MGREVRHRMHLPRRAQVWFRWCEQPSQWGMKRPPFLHNIPYFRSNGRIVFVWNSRLERSDKLNESGKVLAGRRPFHPGVPLPSENGLLPGRTQNLAGIRTGLDLLALVWKYPEPLNLIHTASSHGFHNEKEEVEGVFRCQLPQLGM